MEGYTYEGSELDLFAAATRWKSYLQSEMAPFLSGQVLEVGAGIGTTTRALFVDHVDRWTCLEPDPALVKRLRRSMDAGEIPAHEVVQGTLDEVAERRFDTIVYVDVLEHIEQDRQEVGRAARLLTGEGHLIALSPAHNWLFSPFDRAIGHHRRYDRAMVRALTPPSLDLVRLSYLDAAGLLASAGNRILLRSATPTRRQIRTWDRLLVPLSRVLDPLLRYRVGKSILSVWRKRRGDPDGA